MDEPLTEAFAAASAFLVEVVRSVPESAWEGPGLGEWKLRELVGHANRAHSTLEEYLLRPQPPEPKGSPYFSEQAIAARGREAVAALGDDPAAALAESSARVTALVEATPLDATVGSPAGTMTLGDYLPSRIAELTIHALDVAAAIGTELVPPRPALEESLAFVGRHSARKEGVTVLLALSGRANLPAGFSVY